MRVWIGLFIIILGVSTLFLLNKNLIFYSVILLFITFVVTVLITIYELFCSFHNTEENTETNNQPENYENNNDQEREIVVEGDYL